MGATTHPAASDAGLPTPAPAVPEPVAAAPAEVALDAAPSEGEPSEPSPDQAADVSPTEAVEAEPAEAPPSPGDFGWATWDGSVDSLPEASRDWAKHVLEWKESRSADQAREVERLREYYSSWLEGAEDPRIGELSGSLEDLRGKHLTAEQERDAIREEYDSYKQGVSDYYQAETKRRADSFKAENGWIFDGGAKEAAGSEMLDEGWPLSSLPVALKLKPEHLKRARERFGSRPELSASDREERAALVMELIASSAPSKPKNKSASIVAGSDSTPSQSPRVDTITRDNKSLRQQRLDAARHNINKARRGS